MNPTVICEESRPPWMTEAMRERSELICRTYASLNATTRCLNVTTSESISDLLDWLLDAQTFARPLKGYDGTVTAFSSITAGKLAARAAILRFADRIACWTLSTDEMMSATEPQRVGGDEDPYEGHSFAEVYLDIDSDGLVEEASEVIGSDPEQSLKMYGLGSALHTDKAEYYLPDRVCVRLARSDSAPTGFLAMSVYPVVYLGLSPIDATFDFRPVLGRTHRWEMDSDLALGGYYRYLCEPGDWPYDVTYMAGAAPDNIDDVIVIDEGPTAADGLRHVCRLGQAGASSFYLEVTRHGRIVEDPRWEIRLDNRPDRRGTDASVQLLDFSADSLYGLRGFDERRPEMAAFVRRFLKWMYPGESEA